MRKPQPAAKKRNAAKKFYAAKKPNAAKSGPRRKAVSARPAVLRPAKRPAAAPTRAKTGRGAKGWKATSFAISHLREGDFKVDGLRPYAAYRDLGLAKATNGMVQAHVIHNVRSFNAADVSKRHYHDVDFQLVYCIKGSMKSEMDGKILEITAGTCWIQPPRIKHTVLDYSDDLELLEIILPAEFDTVEVPPL
jgi:mannose-6-phosphate isomerase-like protein (cupin superfamily)